MALASEIAAEDLIAEFNRLDDVAALSVVGTSDATDLPESIALANELKAKVNEILNTFNA